jgi:hypothetical protein
VRGLAGPGWAPVYPGRGWCLDTPHPRALLGTFSNEFGLGRARSLAALGMTGYLTTTRAG